MFPYTKPIAITPPAAPPFDLKVDNFPGFPEGVTGPDLMNNMRDQAARWGAVFKTEDVEEVDFSTRPFVVRSPFRTVKAQTVIVATGAVCSDWHLRFAGRCSLLVLGGLRLFCFRGARVYKHSGTGRGNVSGFLGRSLRWFCEGGVSCSCVVFVSALSCFDRQSSPSLPGTVLCVVDLPCTAPVLSHSS